MLKYLLLFYLVSAQTVRGKSLLDFNHINGRFAEEEILVIDTDAGVDDAMAISMVLNGTKDWNIRIAGITCIRGNTGVHNVTKNVLRTLKVNDRLQIPVMEGSDFGLIATSPVDDYFGEDGFGDFNYPVPDVPLSTEHPAVFLSNVVRQNPGKVTVLALAPLTNLAIAGLLYADFYRDVRQIIFLGGSTSGTGSMDGVEFNIWADPSAAMAVFRRSPLDNPITIIPSETLRPLRFPWEWRKHVLGMKGTDVINFLNSAEISPSRKENPKGWKVDDPTAAAVFLNPEIVLDSFLGHSHLTASGSMKIDNFGDNSSGFVRVIGSINRSKLKQHLLELL